MQRCIPPCTRKSVKSKMYVIPECHTLSPAPSVGMWEHKRYAIWEGAVDPFSGCHSQGREVCGVKTETVLVCRCEGHTVN